MPWLDLEAEIVETFAILVVPTFAGCSTFSRSEHETEKERAARARLEQKARERLAYFRERYRKEAMLVPVEKDGAIWMLPSPATERRRAAAREFQKNRKAAPR